MVTFTLLIGLPGSGKSSYAEKVVNTMHNMEWISSDNIRQELWGDANDQQNHAKVFDTMLKRSIAALKAGKNVIYDATNLVAKTRTNTLKAIRAQVDCEAAAIFFACSISECKLRQGGRDRKVPDEVIDRMVRRFEAPWYNEGWDFIWVSPSGKRQGIDREHWRMLGESHDNPHHTASLEMHCVNCETNMMNFLAKIEEMTDRDKEVLIEAAYQHDLGKHKTKAFFNAKGEPTDIAHYYSHNNVGAYLWLSGDKAHRWSNDEFLFIGLLIQWHMQPFFLRDENGEYIDNLIQWCRKKNFDNKFCDAVVALHEADLAAH